MDIIPTNIYLQMCFLWSLLTSHQRQLELACCQHASSSTIMLAVDYLANVIYHAASASQYQEIIAKM